MGLLLATTKAGLNSLFVNIQPTATFVHCIHDIPPGKKYDGSPIVNLLYYTSFMGHMPWIKCGSIKETRTVWRAGLSAQWGTNYVVVSTLMIAEIRFRSQWCRKA